MGEENFLVGIDLGTTNSSLSFICNKNGNATSPDIVDHSPIQVVRPFETAPGPLLPSFLYFSNSNDLPEGCLQLPWSPPEGQLVKQVIGEFARHQGGLISSNVVHSAKSWLSNPGADPNQKILPWPGSPEGPKISPVEASTAFLRHMVDSWTYSHGKKFDFSGQEVVLTVPASFDDLGRRLTLEAAQKAGIAKPRLLEEPQAAFYCWMAEQDNRIELGPGKTILVVDVGGGTTDFSLIETREEDGDIAFGRKAVGDHLLLGGDNMDMALARFVEGKIKGSSQISLSQFQSLIQQCRLAKERILSEVSTQLFNIQLEGKGRSLVGGNITFGIQRSDVLAIVLDGFFPLCSLQDSPQEHRRQGAIQVGLPYAQDPAITRHLARFLNHHGLEKNPPDALLLNGGCFHSEELRNRLTKFFEINYPDKAVRMLSLGSVDRAVSRGAAYYAWLIQSGKKAIRSSAAKSYYLVLEEGQSDKSTVLCVLPRGSITDMEHPVKQHQFTLKLGTPVRFPLLSSTTRMDDEVGSLMEAPKSQFHSLPALQSVLTGGRKAGQKTTKVHLVSKLTAVGTLDLYLLDDNGNRWHLDFNLHREISPAAGKPNPQTTTCAIPEQLVSEAIVKIQSVYPADSNHSEETPAELTKDLERILDSGRENWSATLCRHLWAPLQIGSNSRRLSQPHLSRWYNLSGWVLRPGFGHPQDPHFVEQLWKALHAPPKGQSGIRQPEGGPELWILLRRIAGGLVAGKQIQVMERLKPFLIPSKSKALFKPTQAELMEMWRCAASLERVGQGFRQSLADTLHRKIIQKPQEASGWQIWCLGRLGARFPTHGTITAILPRESAEEWIKSLLPISPSSETEGRNLGLALIQMGLVTYQPQLDIAEATRSLIHEKIKELNCPEWMIGMLHGKEAQNSRQIAEANLGESIPLGLNLAQG